MATNTKSKPVTTYPVRKELSVLVALVERTEGWKVLRLGKDQVDVANPEGRHVQLSLTITTAAQLATAKELLRKMGWDPDIPERVRKEKAVAAMEADSKQAQERLDRATEQAAQRHAQEVARFRANATPGTVMPGTGELVGFPSEPRFFTHADARAALATLEGSTLNRRRISEANVTRLRRYIETGTFRYSPQGIAYDTEGVLGDGKHRLRALLDVPEEVLAEKYETYQGKAGLWLHVTWNVPSEVFDDVDTGRSRSGEDVLLHHGYDKHAREVSGALNLLLAYDAGVNWRDWGRQVYTNQERLHALRGPYRMLIADAPEGTPLEKQHTPLADAERLRKSRMKMNLTSALVFSFLIQREVPYPVWERFLMPLLTGKGYEPGDDPRQSMRENLINKQKKPTEARRAMRELGIGIKTWNKWASGLDQDVATFRKNEKMPRVLPSTRDLPDLAENTAEE